MIKQPPLDPPAESDYFSTLGLGQVAIATDDGSHDQATDQDTPGKGLRPYLAAGSAYLGLSLVIWWHVLVHPGTATTCGCGDNALTLWVIKWPAYAISHGLNPLFSTKILVPHGINMVPNSLALGILAAPITWLSGPVAALNVIDVLAPPLSALAMFWLLRRWVAWWPACFAGGLFFGFSPFAMVSLALGHPNFGLLAPIPLMIGCLDELFVRRRRAPARTGVVLGVLIVLEFFISVEVLLLSVLFSLFAAMAVGLGVLVTRPPGTDKAIRSGVVGLSVAAGVAGALLAYPLWYYFRGPAHLVGRAWPDSPAGTVATTPGDFVNGFIGRPLTAIMHLFGGYQGPRLPLLSYLGIGVLAVFVAGAAIWWRDHHLMLFGLLGLIGAALSLGVVNGRISPWRLFTHVAVLNNVVPVNISAIIDTCAAVVLAFTVGHVRSAAKRAGDHAATVAGAAMAVLALVPVAAAIWPNLPMTVRPAVVPGWFATATTEADGNQVVLPYPAALGGIQSSLWWQASGDLSFSMVGGGGPGISPTRADVERPGFDLLARASLPLGPAPLPTPANLAAIRSAMTGWGVTTVVIPDEPSLPTYDRGRSIPYAVGLFTAVLGEAPAFSRHVWVWSAVTEAGASVPIDGPAFTACVAATASRQRVGAAVAACVLRAKQPASSTVTTAPQPQREAAPPPTVIAPLPKRTVEPVR